LSVFVHFQLSCEINALFPLNPGVIEELWKKIAQNLLLQLVFVKIHAVTTLTLIIKTDKHDK